MDRKLKLKVGAGVAAAAAVAGGGAALAADRLGSSGALPLFFGPRGGPHEHFGELDAAASYLGLTEAALETQLASGKSLAQVAKDRGKSVDGLIQAMVDSATKRLDAAVAAGRLTKAQEQQILSGLKQRITDFVNGVRHREHVFRFDRGFAGPPGPPPD